MPIDYYWPDAGEKYLYIRVYNPWVNDFYCYPVYLAIPIRAGHVNHIRDIETSRFENDGARSYNGATNVRHMAVDGQLLLEFSPGQAARYREHRSRYRGRGLSEVQVGYPYPNGLFCPGPCSLDRDVSTIEGFSLTPSSRRVAVNKWDITPSNLDHFICDFEEEALVIGFNDNGTFSYEWQRAWTHDVYRITFHWEVDRVHGNVGFGCEFEIHADIGGLSSVGLPNDPESIWHRYGEGKYHVKFPLTRLELSDELRNSLRTCNKDNDAQYTSNDFRRSSCEGEELECSVFDLSRQEWCRPQIIGWKYLHYHTFVGYAPWWGTYHMVLPENRLDDLYQEFQKLEDWIVGRQLFLWSFSEVEPYNLGYKPLGKDRGNYTIWTTLQKEAIEGNKRLDSSIWMFLQDIVKAKEDWGNLFDQLKTDALWFSNHRKSPLMKIHWVQLGKNGSNTYLPILYGWRLTHAEAVSIGKELNRIIFDDAPWDNDIRYLGPQRETERFEENKYVEGFSGLVKFCWQADVDPTWNVFSEQYAVLDEMKAWPELHDAWDWVKYSFVINWLTKVPLQLLEWYDFQAWKANYALLQVQRSVKFEGHIEAFSVIGNYAIAYPGQLLDCKYYRRYWNEVFDPMPSFLTHLSGNTIFNHLVETSALVIQRL